MDEVDGGRMEDGHGGRTKEVNFSFRRCSPATRAERSGNLNDN